MLQRFLNPSILTGISGLDLVAKTVVDGFVTGLHRSPDFGFSHEFAEDPAYLRLRGNEVVLFRVLGPKDVRPDLNGPSIVVDLETKKEYRQAAELGDCSPMAGRPLDIALKRRRN